MSKDTQSVDELKAFASSVVARALRAGATAAEAYVRRGTETDIAIRNGKVEMLTEGGPRSVGLRVWDGDRSASTYATDFSDRAIERLIADTRSLARLTDPVPEQALIEAKYLADSVPDLDLFDPALASVGADEKLALVRDAESAAMGFDRRITASAGAGYGDLIMAHALATSHGFCEGYRESFVSLNVEVIADDAGGRKRNGSWYTFGRHRDQLRSADEVGRTAGERAIVQLGSGPVPTRKLPVVFDPRTAAALLGLLFSVLKGGAIERRASYLADRLGERIGAELLTVIDDPTIPRGPGSRPFDGEGQPACRTTFVDAGVLRTYALNSYGARKLGMSPTGHSSRPASGGPGETSSNLFIAAGDRPPGDLIAEVEYGFYCESMMGFGFSPATGDFSRGAAGRLIEGGKLTRPVSKITLSGNLADMLAAIDAVADDLTHERSTSSPTLRIGAMTLGGT